jgi:hypothetical protein
LNNAYYTVPQITGFNSKQYYQGFFGGREMLKIRQNFWETHLGKNPDRFVKQWEYLQFIGGKDPIARSDKRPTRGGPPVANEWGIYREWPEHVFSSMPMHDSEHVVIKDIAKWRDYVKAPKVIYPESEWKDAVEAGKSVDRSEYFAALMLGPGIFDYSHHLQGIEEALINLLEEPVYMKELIAYLTEYELSLAEQYCKYYRPDAICHHDDWGSQISSFMSPEVFNEFFVDLYRQLYSYYKEHGVEVLIHHSDSYAANLVKFMPEMKIDVWQGCMSTNNTPQLIKEYGGRISFMGDLDNGVLDRETTTREQVKAEVERACSSCGKHYFIPCLVRGGPGSMYPGIYDWVNEEIDNMSRRMF